MNQFMPEFWQLNVELSLLLCAVLLARMLLRRTTRNHSAYLLWGAIPLGLFSAWAVKQLPVSEPPLPAINGFVQIYVAESGTSISAWSRSFSGDLLLVWIVVGLALLLRLLVQHFKLRKQLSELQVADSKISILSSRYPVVGLQASEFSPAVYGFIQPKIYFPVHLINELSAEQIALIVQHEEHHIRQKHLWLNLLWDLLVCLFWFNPLMYIARQQFRHDQELFCDYLVLHRADSQAQKSYGHALLSTISATHSVSLLCSWRAFNQLEERIMNIKRPASLLSRITTVLGALAVVVAASLYTVNAHEYGETVAYDNPDGAHQSDLHIQKFNDDIRIQWLNENRHLLRENDDYYAIENGNKRQMTKLERAEFEREIEQSHEHEAARLEQAEIRLEVEREAQRYQVELEQQYEESATRQFDLKAEIQREQQNIENEVNEQLAEHKIQLEGAQQKIESSRSQLHSSYASRAISKQALASAERDLANAERHVKREQDRLKREARRAKAEIARLRTNLERSKVRNKNHTQDRKPELNGAGILSLPTVPPSPVAPPIAIQPPVEPFSSLPPLSPAPPRSDLVHKDGSKFRPSQVH